MTNIIRKTDSYKLSRWRQMPPGITKMYAYGEPRKGGKYPTISYFGMQMVAEDLFKEFITKKDIDYAEEKAFQTFGDKGYFDRRTWERVLELGHYPIKLMSAPEGMEIEEGNVCFTLESTESWFATNALSFESCLMHVWYPTTVATRAMYIKRAISPLFEKTCDAPSFNLPFAVNDFGLRGATGDQAAERGGAGHLIHFMGSDNEPAADAIEKYYGGKGRLKSIWATEHQTALAWGDEKAYIIHQLKESNPSLPVAIVIDTKDSDNFIQNIVGDREVIELIKEREGRVVLRPDSGDAETNILKYLDMLGGIFGVRINNKQYKIIDHNVGLIQGDGMDEDTIPSLFEAIVRNHWSCDNLVTGSGGGLLQIGLSRDTSRWAIKPSYMEIDGKGINLMKAPKTDLSKSSKPGMLKLHSKGTTISSAEESLIMFEGYTDLLKPVYIDGTLFTQNFNDIIKRANA